VLQIIKEHYGNKFAALSGDIGPVLDGEIAVLSTAEISVLSHGICGAVRQLAEHAGYLLATIECWLEIDETGGGLTGLRGGLAVGAGGEESLS